MIPQDAVSKITAGDQHIGFGDAVIQTHERNLAFKIIVRVRTAVTFSIYRIEDQRHILAEGLREVLPLPMASVIKTESSVYLRDKCEIIRDLLHKTKAQIQLGKRLELHPAFPEMPEILTQAQIHPHPRSRQIVVIHTVITKLSEKPESPGRFHL